ncbi:MAG TPA: PDZ domain-containing protein [Rhodospirillales bacterium]
MGDPANRHASGVVAAALALALLATPQAAAAADSGFLGMHVQGMSPETAAALGLKSANGVLVRDVAVGGPSDQAGIRRGDLILKFAGQAIDTFERMIKVAGATRPGQEAKIELLREGKPVTLTMKMGAWTEAWRVGAGAIASHPESGLTLAALTDKLRKGFGLRWGSLGVVVTLVDPDRSDIGLRRGDLIAQVNQDSVWKPDQVIAKYNAAKAAGRKELLLLVERIDGFHYMLLPVR